MFEIHGDEITFRGIHFATIDGKAWPSLRAEAEDRLSSIGARIHSPSRSEYRAAIASKKGEA